MIRRTCEIIRWIDAHLYVTIMPGHMTDEPVIWLHSPEGIMRLNPGDAHVAATMLQAAVAETLGAAPKRDDEAVAQEVARLMAKSANTRAARMRQAGAVGAEYFISRAREAVAMVREAEGL